MQFAFQLLSRSRISYDDLRVRDSHFADATDRWFKSQTNSGAEGPALVAAPPMFTPLELRSMTLQNRAVASAVSSCTAAEGMPGELHEHELLKRARGGVGLVLSEVAAVSPEGRITPGCAGIYRPEHGHAWKKIVTECHSTSSAKIAIRLGHAGRRGATRPRWEGIDVPLTEKQWPLLSASAIPYTAMSQVPKEASTDDMAKVREDFVRAATMAAEAGFDAIELHCAQGYLLGSFLSPLTNRRGDVYGGALENRMRFPLEIFDAVRSAWPEEKPVCVAVPVTDWATGGFEAEDATIFAGALKELGCDWVEILAGQTTVDSKPVYAPGFLTTFSDQIRNEAHIATMAAGHLTTTDQVNTIIAAGRADLCIMDLAI
jgi:anthraniloyl-CoA monooxygenase